MAEKTAVILGGTVPHCELVRQLKARGYRTVLVDYLEAPPAAKSADIHLRESTLDKDKVYEIAVQYKASLVIATNIDHANSTACYVLEKMGLRAPYSYQTSIDMTDKQRMKTVLKENGIPTADFQIVTSAQDEIRVPLPAVVKPVDSNGSRGVCVAETAEKLKEAVAGALESSKTGRAVVEEYISGKEASVYTFIAEGKAHVILSNLRCVMEDRKTGLMPGVSMMYPCPFNDVQKEKIQQICQASAKAFGLDNTPLLLQIKFEGDKVNVIELMPRIGGGQSYWNIRALTGFDMVSAAIDSFEGKQVVPVYHTPSGITVTNHVYAYSCRFGSVLNLEEIRQSGIADEISVLRAPGSEITSDLSSGNRVCSFVVNGSTEEEIIRKSKAVFAKIDILDINGNSMMRRDMIPAHLRDSE